MLFRDTKESQSPCNPFELYATLQKRKNRFAKLLNGRMQDSHEFLMLLAEEMEKAVHSLNWFEKYFLANMRTFVQCLACENIYESYGSVGDFAIDMNGHQSVQIALDLYFDWESVHNFHCVSCKKKVSAKKQYSLVSPPQCLCITLKRFSKYGRINHNIEITPELTMTKYCAKKPQGPESEWKYKLVTVINHQGKSRNSGHYTAITCSENNQSYEFDDKTVRQISGYPVKRNEAYILFYECTEVINLCS